MQSMADFTNMTERLALMPDPALQQFAQMHRDDPFTLALAVSESNRRKKMRTAQQGVAGMQQQPPVADQEIAQMNEPAMPENVGIGALPAPVLAGMPAGGIAGEEEVVSKAGGGLVAFADGGNVERYSGEFGSFTGSQGFFGASPAELAADELRRQALLRERAENLRISALIEGREPSTLTNTAAPAAIPDVGPYDRATATRRDQYTQADTRGGPPPTPGAGPGANPAVPGGGLGDLTTLYNRTLSAQNYKDPAEERLKALEAKELAATKEEKAALERDQARFMEAFKGREGRLTKRESDIEKQRGENIGLAFLTAGLNTMSTPGGLAVALGKGAQVGTQQFASGLDKIRSAQEKLDEARDRMEELKLNRDEMSAKEIRAAESKIRQVGIDAEKRGIDGLRQAGQINREQAKTIFENTVRVGITREEIAGRERAADRAAARNPQLELLQAVQKDPSLAQAYQSLHGTKGDLMSQYTDYIKGNPGGTIEDFLKANAVFSTLKGVTAAKPVTAVPAGASVAPRTP